MRQLVLGFVAGLAGLLLNLVPIEVLPAVHVLLGPLAVIAAAVIGGPVAGLVAGAISAIPTVPLWGHPWAVIGFTFEGFAVGALRERLRPALADLLFWCGGVPYLFVTYVLISGFPTASFPAVAVKQPLNGMLAALVVQVVLLLPALRRRLPRRLPRPLLDYPARSAFSGTAALAAILPLLVLGVLEGRERYRRELRRVADENAATARTVALALEERLESAQRSVELVAQLISQRVAKEGTLPPQEALEELLDPLVARTPHLLNAYVGDERGVARAFSPRTGPEGEPLVGREFSDRPYFKQAQLAPDVIITGVFQGRGGTDDPLVVTVVPIWREGKLRAYVLGALDLQVLAELAYGLGVPGQRIRVLDDEGNVVVAPRDGSTPVHVVNVTGTPLGQALEQLRPGLHGEYTTSHRQLAADRSEQRWHFTSAPVGRLSWRVVVEQPEFRLSQLVQLSYARLILGVVIALGCLVALVALLTPVLVRPLRHVSAAATRLAVGEEGARTAAAVEHAPLELRELGRNFDHMAGELERRLTTIEAQSRAKDEFLTIASHELKTPITALKAQLQLLIRLKAPAGPERVELLSRQVDRLARLVERLLDASQLGSGRLPVERTEADLAPLVQRVAEALVLPSSHHTLRLEVEPVRGLWDELRLEQVVHNLVANAVKYSPAGGEIAITLREADGQANLTISDPGVGLGGVDPESLFGRFSRGNVRGVRQIAGLGVGLYISREIVRLHGGDIRLSPREGGGTVAHVTLPIAAA